MKASKILDWLYFKTYLASSSYTRTMLLRGLLVVARRQYSDFMKDLPRVGLSKFGLKKKPVSSAVVPPGRPASDGGSRTQPAQRHQQRPQRQGQTSPPETPILGNRFAAQYSKNSGNQRFKGGDNRTSGAPGESSGSANASNGTRAANTSTKFSNNANKTARGSDEQLNEYNKAKDALRQAEKKNHKSGARTPSRASNSSGKKNQKHAKTANKPKKEAAKIHIQIPTFVTVSNLATIMNVYLNDLLKKLVDLGFEDMLHNYILDKETASLIADEYNFVVTMNDDLGADLFPGPVVESKLKPRAPIVTIMGHVDHGKTTILDYLRKSSVVDQEHGGITQHIGAFSVITPISKKKITFLDTPGHAAFLKMRERGANITDIVILVVAADDSVMPQTIEAIKHAKKSGVPIIVAVNKCDKPTANPDKVIADVSGHGIEVEDYGGDTQTVRVSGKTGLNMDKLEEAVITLSEMIEFQSEAEGVPAEGWVIESEMKKGLGNVATVLVKRGSVKRGSIIVAGNTYCKIRGMKDELGKDVKLAGPSTPVVIWGWKDLPNAGDQVLEAKTEQFGKKVCENRTSREKQIKAASDIEHINSKRLQESRELAKQEKLQELKAAGLTINDLSEEDIRALGAGELETKDVCEKVNFIIKSDVYGSAEAIKESIDGLGNEEVKAVVIFEEAGHPTELDLDRAEAANAQILCFNMKVTNDILGKAANKNVEIKQHNVIYHLIEDVTKCLTDKLKPIIENRVLAEAEVKDVFTITGKNKNKFKIAGCKVSTGIVKRTSNVLVQRDGKDVFKGKLSSLKHVKDDVNEVKKGADCGMAFEGWNDFASGDIIKVYEEVVHPRFL